MSFINKLKNKFLEQSNSYSYYKENYIKLTNSNNLNKNNLEHLQQMNSLLKKDLEQSNLEKQKLLEIIKNNEENNVNIKYIKNQVSKLNDINDLTSQIPQLNEKLETINNLTSQIPQLNSLINMILTTQKNDKNRLNEIKNLLIEKNDLIITKNNENYLFVEKNIQHISLKLEKIFDTFSSVSLKEFENLNYNLDQFNQNITSENSKQFSEMVNILNSNHMLIYSSLNKYFEELNSYKDYLNNVNNNLNKINKQVNDYNDEIIFVKNNSEHSIKNIEKLNDITLKNNEDLKNITLKYDKNLEKIMDNILSLNKKISDEWNSYHYKQLFKEIDEIRYSMVFNDTIENSKWFKSTSLSLNNSSSNYSFMYVLYRILNEIKPNNILELGLGQTSLMTSAYANKYNKNLLIIESNNDWIKTFSKKLTKSEKIIIQQLDTEEFKYKSTINSRYKSMKNYVKNKKFDLIIIDGPNGYNIKTGELYEYSRSNIWDLIDNIDDEFIIIFDDCEREGEKNTAKHLCELLDLKNVNYVIKTFKGSKEQLVICSTKYNFVSWF